MPPFICWYDHYLTNNISCPHYLGTSATASGSSSGGLTETLLNLFYPRMPYSGVDAVFSALKSTIGDVQGSVQKDGFIIGYTPSNRLDPELIYGEPNTNGELESVQFSWVGLKNNELENVLPYLKGLLSQKYGSVVATNDSSSLKDSKGDVTKIKDITGWITKVDNQSVFVTLYTQQTVKYDTTITLHVSSVDSRYAQALSTDDMAVEDTSDSTEVLYKYAKEGLRLNILKYPKVLYSELTHCILGGSIKYPAMFYVIYMFNNDTEEMFVYRFDISDTSRNLAIRLDDLEPDRALEILNDMNVSTFITLDKQKVQE